MDKRGNRNFIGGLRAPRDLALFAVLGMAIVFMLASASDVWATPGQDSLRQTVPTPTPPATSTPVPSPTPIPPATSTPAPPPAPTPVPTSPPQAADPVITKMSDSNAAAPGDTVTFTLRVTNKGTVVATNVIITDPIEDYLSIKDITASRGAVKIEGNTIVVNVGTLPPGEEVMIIILTSVKDGVAAGTIIHNQAWLAFDGGTRQSEIVAVGLPPAELPPVGGSLPALLSVRLLALTGMILLGMGLSLCLRR